jgi:hypothetical protein
MVSKLRVKWDARVDLRLFNLFCTNGTHGDPDHGPINSSVIQCNPVALKCSGSEHLSVRVDRLRETIMNERHGQKGQSTGQP